MKHAGNELARAYFDGLRNAYARHGGGAYWEQFAAAAQGVEEADLAALKALYPALPASLEALLRLADGTYHRDYPKGKVCLYVLGSDLEEYPYYLLSAKQMIETRNDFQEWGGYLINREFDDPVDEKITGDLASLCWLHFSDCMNNGGSSQLFLDFSPSEQGTSGQVVRYLHDPDELEVIADSFDAYLRMLMEGEYDFIDEDAVED